MMTASIVLKTVSDNGYKKRELLMSTEHAKTQSSPQSQTSQPKQSTGSKNPRTKSETSRNSSTSQAGKGIPQASTWTPQIQSRDDDLMN
jgi:hypothetical protein